MTDAASPRASTTRVLLAVRPRLMREMLGRLIRRHPALHLVGQVDDPARLEACVAAGAPECVVMSMDDAGRLDPRLRHVRRRYPGLRLVALSPGGRLLRPGPHAEPVAVDTAADLLETLCAPGPDPAGEPGEGP
ncbi:hypothetical protein GQ464_007020 [Rhodocaloribacter litoris]|uniref:response regulator transcription factor n=1 Tax=Rhodocaloribacter litoris TaxID=2558931 RepID=UPI001423BE55|nr:response regulator transcription factor [Rhodocaloribacter litoris]QXD16683.1 hypothetical protein GQ464_007020 [Rhodocaloribacter litoris]